ncbi:BrnT family toxin [Alcaligenaceae bacterium C4P045]|nr:BrnT family toxin [Alcaligenaceae bacterium C4P045]
MWLHLFSRISYDPAKNARNVQERQLHFRLARDIDWCTATVVEDIRRAYGESRFQAIGRIYGRVHVLVFNCRHGGAHIISLRRANTREVMQYEKSRS